MLNKHKLARGASLLALLATALCAGGCGNTFSPDAYKPPSSLGATIIDEDDSGTAVEDLSSAAQRIFVDQANAVVNGRVDAQSDIDVYDLGPVESGDHVQVDMTPGSGFEGAIAAFDDAGAALLVNDHRNAYLGRKTPFIDIVIRRRSEACYIVVSSTPGYDSTGAYALTCAIESGMSLPPGRPDVVLLNFEGADEVRIGGRAAVDVPPFDAASIDRRYAGMTDEIMDVVLDKVREDYLGFDVQVVSTADGAVDDGTMTVLHFGTFDAALLGVADNIDEFNATSNQEAIIFTDTFAAFMPINPTADELAQALANVASHELGHLLGLVHTADSRGIMDVTASLSQLVQDQHFSRSPLFLDVFPLGDQDAIQCLVDSVGGDEIAAREKAEEVLSMPRIESRSRTFDLDRGGLVFSSSDLPD